MNEVLQTKLRERIREELGGTYGVGVSGSNSWRPTGEYSITIQFGSDPERVNELKEVIFQEIRNLQTLGPDSEDLANSLEARRRSRETNLESNSYWVTQLAHMYRQDQDLSYFWGFEASLEEVTPESVRAAAQRYFDLENYVQVTLYPESMRGGGL
jgi:zinc protease